MRVLRKISAMCVAAGCVATILLGAPTAATAMSGCAQNGVSVMFARGSGEHLNDKRAHQFYWSVVGSSSRPGWLRKLGYKTTWVELGNEDEDVKVNMDDDPDKYGKRSPRPNQKAEYPAVAVENLHAINIASGAYARSVNTGLHELATYLNKRSARCPNEIFVLGGYSQGAEVVGRLLTKEYDGKKLDSGLFDSVKRRIGYAALYGDPKFDAGSPKDRIMYHRVPWWVKAEDLGYREKAGNIVPNNGVLGARKPYASGEFKERLGSWCAKGDGVCAGLFPKGMDVHSNAYQNTKNAAGYTRQGWIDRSAYEIAGRTAHRIKICPSPRAFAAMAIGTTIGHNYIIAFGTPAQVACSSGRAVAQAMADIVPSGGLHTVNIEMRYRDGQWQASVVNLV